MEEGLNTDVRIGGVMGDPLLVLSKKCSTGHAPCRVAAPADPKWTGPQGLLVLCQAQLVTLQGDSIDISPRGRGIS